MNFSTLPEKTRGVVDCGQVLRQQRRQGVRLTSVLFPSIRRSPKHGRGDALLQPKLNLRVSQRQVLTPGLVQMVSVLALNKLELKEMINTEMVENPVLEELEESDATLEEMSASEAERERSAEEVVAANERVEKKDPFDEIDFGSYFQDRSEEHTSELQSLRHLVCR